MRLPRYVDYSKGIEEAGGHESPGGAQRVVVLPLADAQMIMQHCVSSFPQSTVLLSPLASLVHDFEAL